MIYLPMEMDKGELRETAQASQVLEDLLEAIVRGKKIQHIRLCNLFSLMNNRLTVLNWVKQVAKSPSENELLNRNAVSPVNFRRQQPSSLQSLSDTKTCYLVFCGIWWVILADSETPSGLPLSDSRHLVFRVWPFPSLSMRCHSPKPGVRLTKLSQTRIGWSNPGSSTGSQLLPHIPCWQHFLDSPGGGRLQPSTCNCTRLWQNFVLRGVAPACPQLGNAAQWQKCGCAPPPFDLAHAVNSLVFHSA